MKKALFLLILLAGCSSGETEKRAPLPSERIYRGHQDRFYEYVPKCEHRIKEHYPWEGSQTEGLARITKEFFCCQGSDVHAPRQRSGNGSMPEYDFDCGGVKAHGLPLREGKEFIYPILIDLLNYVQQRTKKRVVITCGHRCPAHNTYADSTPFNRTSKHMIGAEVDFYVQGMEEEPLQIVELIMDFYRESTPEYQSFVRFDGETNVKTRPWYNKEILIKLFEKEEGRDLDNRHPYPYICIQVRYDKAKGERVTYTWEKAFRGFHRY